jgi:hypothetical protein
MSTLEAGQHIEGVQSYESNLGILYTSLGTFDLRPVATSTVSGSASADRSRSPIPLGYGLGSKGTCITYQGENVLWLPTEYRPSGVAVSGTAVAVGCTMGRVLIFRFFGGDPVL